MDLPLHDLIVTSCDDCGACCSKQGAPPDYVALTRNPQFADDPSFTEDVERLAGLPVEARELLCQYFSDIEQNPNVEDGNCCWLDLETLKCRFYEWRPSTCRVFELNSPGCHIYRKHWLPKRP